MQSSSFRMVFFFRLLSFAGGLANRPVTELINGGCTFWQSKFVEGIIIHLKQVAKRSATAIPLVTNLLEPSCKATNVVKKKTCSK